MMIKLSKDIIIDCHKLLDIWMKIDQIQLLIIRVRGDGYDPETKT